MLKTENGIFCTTSPEKTAANVASAISAVNMASITNVPMFAGRKAFIATAVAYEARTSRNEIPARGNAARRIPSHASAASVV